MKKAFLICFSLISFFSYSQTEKALQLYNNAVNYFNKQEYKIADSLFSLSNLIEPNKDTYFSRALCRGKMANKRGYCEDLVYASLDRNEKATKLFCKTCGKIDTSYPKLNQNYTSFAIFSRVIKYSLFDTVEYVFRQKYFSQQSDSVFSNATKATNEKEVFKTIETSAEFPGGIYAMMKFIKENTVMPKTMLQGKDVRKVFLRFIVFEDGTLHEITVLKGTNDCSDCDEEATRVLAIMPKWKAATMNGKKVKCYFNIPFSFKVLN